ncbi:MAG: hypothetical protein KDC83_15350, partial [Flavobacteriales bacterium]|nr:hypothetical protein [Flavobacteriales bacterium]
MKCLILTFSFFLGLNLFSQKTNFFISSQVSFPYKHSCAGIEQKGDKIHSVYIGDRHSGYAMKWVKYDLLGLGIDEVSITCPYDDYGLFGFKIMKDGGLVYNGYGVNRIGPANFFFKLDSNGTEVWSLRDSIAIYHEIAMINDTTILCIIELDKKYKNILPGTYLTKLNSNTSSIEPLKTLKDIKSMIPSSSKISLSSLKILNDDIAISFRVSTSDTSFVLLLDKNGGLLASSGPLVGNLTGIEIFKDNYILNLTKVLGVGERSSIVLLDKELEYLATIFSNDSGLFELAAGGAYWSFDKALIPFLEMDSLRTFMINSFRWYHPERGLIRKCKYTVEDEKLNLSYFQVFSNYSFLSTVTYDSWSGYFSSILKTDSLGLVYNTDIICDCKDFNTGIET